MEIMNNKHRTFAVTFRGETPLLLHPNDIEWSDKMTAWQKDPANKGISKAGDDRTPAWRWIGNIYKTDSDFARAIICIPSDNLMTVLREGGKKVPVGTGKATFKALSQSGLIVNEDAWPLLVGGKPIRTDWIGKLKDGTHPALVANEKAEEKVPDFDIHKQVVSEHGFELNVRSVRVNGARHIRVRPKFPANAADSNNGWSVSGTITVISDKIEDKNLRDILDNAGAYCGLGDWRPSSPVAPGTFGKFTVTMERVD